MDLISMKCGNILFIPGWFVPINIYRCIQITYIQYDPPKTFFTGLNLGEWMIIHQPPNSWSVFAFSGFTWVAQLIESTNLSKRFTSCKTWQKQREDVGLMATFVSPHLQRCCHVAKKRHRYQISQNKIEHDKIWASQNCWELISSIHLCFPSLKKKRPPTPNVAAWLVSAPSNKPNFSGS